MPSWSGWLPTGRAAPGLVGCEGFGGGGDHDAPGGEPGVLGARVVREEEAAVAEPMPSAATTRSAVSSPVAVRTRAGRRGSSAARGRYLGGGVDGTASWEPGAEQVDRWTGGAGPGCRRTARRASSLLVRASTPSVGARRPPSPARRQVEGRRRRRRPRPGRLAGLGRPARPDGRWLARTSSEEAGERYGDNLVLLHRSTLIDAPRPPPGAPRTRYASTPPPR